LWYVAYYFFFEKTQKAFAFHFIEKKEMNIGLSVTTRREGQDREQPTTREQPKL
jgi:hypothetical protein